MSKKGGFLNSVIKFSKAFSKEFKAVRKEQEEEEKARSAVSEPAARNVDTFTPWGFETNRVYDFSGDYERNVIVYDGVPFSHLNRGDEFDLTPFLGDGVMFSRFSDYRHSTRDSNDCILMYNGCPIGFCSIPPKEIKTLAKKGIAIKFKGVCLGDLEGYEGIKNIVAKTKSWLFANNVLESIKIEELGAPCNCPTLDYNEYDEADYAEIATRNYWFFENAILEVIQPERKDVKPKVIIRSGKKQVSKIEAKNRTYYNEVMDIAKCNEKIAVAAKRCSGADDKDFYHITIYHWQEKE